MRLQSLNGNLKRSPTPYILCLTLSETTDYCMCRSYGLIFLWRRVVAAKKPNVDELHTERWEKSTKAAGKDEM